MLKEYLEEQEITIYRLSKETGVPYSTLNNLINRKTDAETCAAGVIKKLSLALGISMDEVYSLCSYTRYIEKDGVNARLYVKGQSFYMDFLWEGTVTSQKVYEIKEENYELMERIGYHEIDKFIKEKERERYVLLFNEKKHSAYNS